MSDLSAFPITRRWPAAHPDRLQLYSLNTPNGVKASIMLEETGLPYEAHLIDITANETWTPEFLSLNPNGKIPAILDPDGLVLGAVKSVQNFGADDMLEIAPAAGGPTWYLPFTREAVPELHIADGWLRAVRPVEVGEREPD